MHNLIEYIANFSKISGSLWQHYRDEPFIGNNDAFIDVPDDPENASFKYKQKITGQTRGNGTKDVKKMILL